MNDIQMFKNRNFQSLRAVMRNNEPWFLAKDVADILGFKTANDFTKYLDIDEKGTMINPTPGGEQKMNIISESGLYSAIFRSKKPQAKMFRKWISSEVLPQIRKNGGYILDEDMFIRTYLPHADECSKIMIKTALTTIKKQDRIVERKNALIEHKENVINGLTQDISLADKRQIINRIIQQSKGNYKERWTALYNEFDAKYHMNVKARFENYNKANKPKLKNSMEYIDKVLGKIPDLFEIACKLFEGEVQALIQGLHLLRNSEIPSDTPDHL